MVYFRMPGREQMIENEAHWPKFFNTAFSRGLRAWLGFHGDQRSRAEGRKPEHGDLLEMPAMGPRTEIKVERQCEQQSLM